MACDLVFIAYRDEFAVFHGKSLCLGEVGVNSIYIGVVDDEVHRRFGLA